MTGGVEIDGFGVEIGEIVHIIYYSISGRRVAKMVKNGFWRLIKRNFGENNREKMQLNLYRLYKLGDEKMEKK